MCISNRLYFYIHDCDESIFCGDLGDFKESELFIFYFPEGYANYWRTLQVHGTVFKAEELSAPQHVTIGNVNLPNDYYN